MELPAGWRSGSDISRRVGTWGMRAMALGGLKLVELTDAERQQLGFSSQNLGLRAEHVGEYGRHAIAKKAGFRKNDVVIEVEGQAQRRTEGQLIGDLLQRHRPGDVIPVVVQRGSERLKLELLQQ
jgi:S1-C subfamily serine protease